MTFVTPSAPENYAQSWLSVILLHKHQYPRAITIHASLTIPNFSLFPQQICIAYERQNYFFEEIMKNQMNYCSNCYVFLNNAYTFLVSKAIKK